MGIAEGYEIHLYCDHFRKPNINPHCWSNRITAVCRYDGPSKGQAHKSAKDDGWRFHANGRHSCPSCVEQGKGVPKQSYFDE